MLTACSKWEKEIVSSENLFESERDVLFSELYIASESNSSLSEDSSSLPKSDFSLPENSHDLPESSSSAAGSDLKSDCYNLTDSLSKAHQTTEENHEGSLEIKENSNPYSEEGIFKSVKELAEYLLSNPDFCERITEENGGIKICFPNNLPEKYTFSKIRLSGSYITYYYKNVENPEEIFALEWAFRVSDAEKFLQNSLNYNYEEITERRGSYVSPNYSTETGEQNGWKIIWVKKGFCFTAIVSDEIFENFKNGTDLVKKEIYS